jgi:hypothetical protein
MLGFNCRVFILPYLDTDFNYSFFSFMSLDTLIFTVDCPMHLSDLDMLILATVVEIRLMVGVTRQQGKLTPLSHLIPYPVCLGEGGVRPLISQTWKFLLAF